MKTWQERRRSAVALLCALGGAVAISGCGDRRLTSCWRDRDITNRSADAWNFDICPTVALGAASAVITDKNIVRTR